MKTTTLTTEQTKKIETLYKKYDNLVQATMWLDHNEKRGTKAACTRAYNKLAAYIESVTTERVDKIIFRLVNP